MKKTYLYSLASLMVLASLLGCKTKTGNAKSDKTGLAYNKKEYGGFQVNNKFRRGPGPGLVEIEGGVFVMSGSAINVPGQELSEYNHKRETTVSSFYMDETEVSNTNWLEYLNWIRTSYPADYEYYYNELPDTLVWRRPLSYNEPYVDNYLRHPAYQDYPVVGVTWEQADRYCSWRTDRVNELLLREKGYMTTFRDLNGTNKAGATTAAARPTEPFNTDIYLNGQYDDKGKRAMKDLNPASTAGATAGKNGATRNVRLEDGILKQPYRLPTEAEWEYAALGLIGNTEYENIQENKIYPWNGLGLSSAKKKTRGLILANFKRTKGDYMGVGGSLNDKGGLTVPVRSYMPNDFGLYNMAGNVNEWVADVYRAKTFEAADAFNPYRGNFYQDKKMADVTTGKIEKDKHNMPVMTAAISARKQTWAEKQSAATTAAATDSVIKKNTYADQRGYRDPANDQYGETTLINDKSRVFKGGSWEDQAVWLNPATRRFLQQDEATADIGFRCAMTMLGASEIRTSGKPQFKPKQQRAFKSR